MAPMAMPKFSFKPHFGLSLCAAALSCLSVDAHADIIPAPAVARLGAGAFAIADGAAIAFPVGDQAAGEDARWLAETVRRDRNLNLVASPAGHPAIVFPNLYKPSDQTFVFLENVLTEVMALFPGPYIHVGGDEAIKDYWVASPEVQAQIKSRGLKDEDALRRWFSA